MADPLHEYSVEEVVETERYRNAETAFHNALWCDAHPEEIAAARHAAGRLIDELQSVCVQLKTVENEARSHA